jgi:glucose/arabinose dehydrogenase
MFKYSFLPSAKQWGLLFAGVLVMAACSAPAPAVPNATPVSPASGGTTAATPTEVANVAEETSGTDSTPAAAATDERVMAPTFDPTQTQIALQPFVEGFAQPLFLTHANDGSNRIFVVEKGGTIRIVRDGQIVEAAFLDISDRVMSMGNEQGLLGLAFAPNYNESGYFFVNYTDARGDTVISRFQVDAANPDVADVSGEFLVLGIAQPARNHNGGMLAFGPDGYLWVGMGDGGGGNDTYGNGQNPATYLGMMLRLDVTSDPAVPYLIPEDNPWVEADWNGADVLDEAWALGLRNPWRYSFDRATGDLWIADVGQNQYEEVNFTPAGSPGGLNFGWPIMEASSCMGFGACDQTGLELPVAEYDHAGGHCSVTGGYVYRGRAFPNLAGVYIFGDYCSGVIWATVPAEDGSWTTTQVLESGAQLSSFGEDESGEMYATDLTSGTIYQVVAQ